MRRVVTADQMRSIDRKTIEEVGVPGIVLMENAGLGVVRMIEEMLVEVENPRVSIFCGKGNNGGDGMVVARHLFNRSIAIDVYLLDSAQSLRGDALLNFELLQGFGIDIKVLTDKKNLKQIQSGDLIVDALLGTGVTGEVTGFTAELVRWINRSNLPVVSVDLPSGLHSDEGSVGGVAVAATRTATMAELKRGLVIPPGRELAGEVEVVDIGAPGFVGESMDIRTFYLEEEDIRDRLPLRPEAAHKGCFGKIFILAGSPGMTGAATLASKACLRVGGGLAILGIPRSLNQILEEKLTEVMTWPLPQTETGTLGLEAEDEIYARLDWADVAAIGPGLSDHAETAELIRRIVSKTKLSVVIDADGLNAFTGHADLLKKGGVNRILTPHFGELARLIDLSIEEIESNRVELARETANRFGCVLVLKGSPTVIASPEGDVYINSTGNSGMATAGSGDVLTGCIVGFLGQGCTPLDAALCGVYMHGLAGDIAQEVWGGRSLIAGDMIKVMGETFSFLEESR